MKNLHVDTDASSDTAINMRRLTRVGAPQSGDVQIPLMQSSDEQFMNFDGATQSMPVFSFLARALPRGAFGTSSLSRIIIRICLRLAAKIIDADKIVASVMDNNVSRTWPRTRSL